MILFITLHKDLQNVCRNFCPPYITPVKVGISGLIRINCFCFSSENLSKEGEHQPDFSLVALKASTKCQVTIYAQTAYTADHAMESCTVPWVIVRKTVLVCCVSGNKHFFVSRKRPCVSGVK